MQLLADEHYNLLLSSVERLTMPPCTFLSTVRFCSLLAHFSLPSEAAYVPTIIAIMAWLPLVHQLGTCWIHSPCQTKLVLLVFCQQDCRPFKLNSLILFVEFTPCVA
jgi:hypothetical protein